MKDYLTDDILETLGHKRRKLVKESVEQPPAFSDAEIDTIRELVSGLPSNIEAAHSYTVKTTQLILLDIEEIIGDDRTIDDLPDDLQTTIYDLQYQLKYRH